MTFLSWILKQRHKSLMITSFFSVLLSIQAVKFLTLLQVNSKNLKQNYRPISLLSIFGKILEKKIYDTLYENLTANELLNPNQSGFHPNDSTINQLLSIVHTIFSAFDCNPPLDVRSVYLDISKAFHRVWHEGLIYKLRRCSISGNLLSLIKDFLANRKQRTVLNGKTSEMGSVTAGVPQGSILGPLFFLVYIILIRLLQT